MKVNLKRQKDCKVQMSVEVDAKMADMRYNEVMKEFQRAARLPGFREGKAPIELVEQRFKSEAREEVLKSLIPEVYHQTIQAQKVSPVSLPRISDVRWEKGQKLQFSAEFDEAPNISLKGYKNIPLKRESAEVTPDELEKNMQAVLESRATFDAELEVRAVRKDDFITVDIELWKDGVYVPGRKGVLLAVAPGQDDDLFDKVQGANVGDAREITRQGQPYTRIHVRGIKKKVVPALNDELAKSLGKENADELREAVRKELAQHKREQAHEKMKQELFTKLLKANNFPLPDSLIERQKERLIEQTHNRYMQMGATEEDWKAELAGLEEEMSGKAKDQVKLYFILQKIADAEKIDLDEVELTQRLNGLAQQSGRPLEEVRRVFEEDLRESLREKKTVEHLIANAKLED
jgi:trigger factor